MDWPRFFNRGRGSCCYADGRVWEAAATADGTVRAQVLPPVVSLLGAHFTRVRLRNPAVRHCWTCVFFNTLVRG
eukprot:CAMPEP_0174359146 /NCGR_PEP_ID=MMETSP0811_2-20130205/46674_1 /TAXON_ID=73025 ORGANISM="Eutreptiella gymnastica-like, Strain CCMP1594" /NCGR_SAMPLE_ID=MMETSP0811_2 /ASSEMBLY_ACC=CAM_ASM_000667 /LENGTH=73 /DNA_ID=CAMNT_0015493527 /DNA_START=285 /DNA_END=501 /DNA_ORIENTATION=+